jgi:predicted helicase
MSFSIYWEQYIEKNWEWVLAYISNNAYLDNTTFRGMRWKLLKTFDTIYIYDLHWNSLKKEKTPEWTTDQNVFDIMVWVNIIFWIKTWKKKKWKLATVYHYDSYGKRQEKYENLLNSSIESTKWNKLNPVEPYYFFVEKDFSEQLEYEKWFSVSELFSKNVLWFQTHRDNFIIWDSYNEIKKRVDEFIHFEWTEEEISKYFWLKATKEWSIINTQKNLLNIESLEEFIVPCWFRPFDNKWTFFSKLVIDRTRTLLVENIFNKENLSLIVPRQTSWNFRHVLCNKFVCEANLTWTWWTNWAWNIFPLYLYQKNKDDLLWEEKIEKVPNLDWEIILKIEKKLWMSFVYSVDDNYSDIKWDYFCPEDLFDYIYSVLHSKSYRETYKEFLKIDFPKVPFNVNKETFFKMVKLWRELRSYHLLENENLIPKNFITKYSIDWDNLVEKIKYDDEKVFINDEQYFEWVPGKVWDFYIWGYQPAQKWLKDRKLSNLGYEDIIHYGKMIVSLNETVRIMEEIERVFNV